MKRLLLGASVCLGLFAFTMNSSSRNHYVASAGYRSLMSDTTKPKDTTKPNVIMPDLASADYRSLVSDTTKPKDTTKPNAIMPNFASADYRVLLSDTTKPKDTTKPNSNMLAVLMPGHGR